MDQHRDPFELLGLPRRFDIDLKALQATYLRKSATLHPDRFTDPLEQADAAERAARLNDAKAVLADDERRANAMLLLLGGPDRDQLKDLPDGFLMDMMETRQEMEHAMASAHPAERKRMEDWAAQQRADYLQTLRDLFAKPGDPPAAEDLRSIRIELNALRYIERMIEQLDPGHKGLG